MSMWEMSYPSDLNKYTTNETSDKQLRDTTGTRLHQPIQLVEAQVEDPEAVLEQVPQAVLEHDADQHAERLLLGHLHITTEIQGEQPIHADTRVWPRWNGAP